MKKGKLFKLLTVLTCAATVGASVLSGCGNGETKCEHKVTEWMVQEATCTTEGVRTGKCALCDEVIEEILPVDVNAHSYSATWNITKPTESEEGLAVKTCKHNAEHVLNVVLPKVTLAGNGYTESSFITVPTTATPGEMKLTLANSEGPITFNVPLEKRTLSNIGDAVILSTSLKDNIRSATGNFAESNDGTSTGSNNAFAYFFGDNYTYIADKSAGYAYLYYYDEDGTVSAMQKTLSSSYSIPETLTAADFEGFTVMESGAVDEGYFNGYKYNTPSDVATFFGAEEGLLKLYQFAQEAMENDKVNTEGKTTCVNYQENFNKHVGGAVQNSTFSYGCYEDGFFFRFNVTFSTFKSGALKSLSVKTETIRPYMIATTDDGTPLFYKEGDTYTDKYNITHELNAGDVVFGLEYPTNDDGGVDYEYKNGKVVYEQQADVDGVKRVIYQKEEGGQTVYYAVMGVNATTDQVVYKKLDYVPVLEDVYLTDCYGRTLYNADGTPVKKKMAKGGYPVTTYYSDTHDEVNYRSVTFTQTEKAEGDVVQPNPYDKNSRYITDFEFESASTSKGGSEIAFIDGTVTLPTKTAVYLNIGTVIPSTASFESDAIENIYAVDGTGNKVKLDWGNFDNGSQYRIIANANKNQITLNSQYAGEVTLLFETQYGKCQKQVTVTFAKAAPSSLTAMASVYNVSGGVADFIEQTVSEDAPVTIAVGQTLKFKAVALGTEAAYVSTDIYPKTSSEAVTFAPLEVGGYGEWSLTASEAGEYIIQMPYYDGTVSSETVFTSFKLIVTPKQSASEKLVGNTFGGTVLMSAGVGVNPTSKSLAVTFGTDGKLTVTVAGNTIVYNYTITDDEISIEYVSGVEPTVKSYDFIFKINDGGDLVVVHETGMGNDKEEIVLTKS